jgi:phosphohistidine phosphatase SixA
MTRSTIKTLLGLLLIIINHSLFAQEIFLVRHAEKKQEPKEDPSLTYEGQARAHWLAAFFTDKSLVKIYSTDYKRTRLTALPTATSYNLDIEFYDPEHPALLVDSVLRHKENTFIVAHSNTLPQLVLLFGGEAKDDIAHDEYDRLYWLSIKEGQVKTQLLKSKILIESKDSSLSL